MKNQFKNNISHGSNKIIKNIISITLILFLFLTFNYYITQAQTPDPPDPESLMGKLDTVGKEAGYEQASEQSLELVIAEITMIVLGFLGILFLILIIISGYQWMMSGGNEETIQKAKKRIINATIGLAIVIFSYIIAQFIQHTLYLASIN